MTSRSETPAESHHVVRTVQEQRSFLDDSGGR
jgi:hypothetical protein